MNIREKIGAELRALRLSKGLTTRELAEVVGMDHSHIVRIESGKYNVRIDTVDALTAALDAEITLKKK